MHHSPIDMTSKVERTQNASASTSAGVSMGSHVLKAAESSARPAGVCPADRTMGQRARRFGSQAATDPPAAETSCVMVA